MKQQGPHRKRNPWLPAQSIPCGAAQRSSSWPHSGAGEARSARCSAGDCSNTFEDGLCGLASSTRVRALPATPHVVQRSQKQAGANEELTDIALSSQVSEQHHRSTTRSECVQAGHRAQCALSSALASHHPRARWTTSLLAVCQALAMPVRAGRTRQQQQAAAATPRIALPHILMCVSVRLVCAAAAGLATRHHVATTVEPCDYVTHRAYAGYDIRSSSRGG